MLGLIVIAVAVFGFCLVSGRLEKSPVTPPMAFAGLGLLIGTAGLGLVDQPVTHGAIHLLAEVTLILVLFSDAARIDLRGLLRDHDLPARMLVIAMPIVIILGAAAAIVLPLGLGLAEAVLLAAILAPTDAALGQSVVSNPAVPVRIRQALNVESGLNDGIAVPFVFMFAALAAGHGGEGGWTGQLAFTAKQLIFGPLAGAAVGWIAAIALKRAADAGSMAMSFEGPAVLAAAGLAYGLAGLIGGNGFIAAFVAGLVFGSVLQTRCKFVLEFAESEGQLLVLLSFLVFGAAMLPELAGRLSWPIVLYAAASLTVVRMVAISISLIGTGVSGATSAFLGWFGPRGLASILFALLVLEEMATPGAKTILTVVIATVGLSIIVHGLTAAGLAGAYGRRAHAAGECAETKPVSEMATRHGGATKPR